MTVKEIAEKLGLTPVSVADDAREVQGGYAGDLLSWVMGRVPEGAAWVTIMTNVNVVAVAELGFVALVIAAAGIETPTHEDPRDSLPEVNTHLPPPPRYHVWHALARAP